MWVQGPWGEIRIKMEDSLHSSSWQKVKVSVPGPCPRPEPFKALYSETDVGPDLRERQGEEEDGLPLPCQGGITTEAAPWKDSQSSCLLLVEVSSKFIPPDTPDLSLPIKCKTR